ncbi:MAG: hypothetical protein LBQ88_18330 [Treponema sp.]|jgi:hypothetical protein|nr:hypothetical protein [Treponema sp.]
MEQSTQFGQRNVYAASSRRRQTGAPDISRIISIIIAVLCITVYTGSIVYAAIRFRSSYFERRALAEREIDQMAVFASSIVFFGFMSQPYQEEIQSALERTVALEGVIITGADGAFGFEKADSGGILQNDNPPRFKTRFGISKDQPFLPLQIENQRNATIRAVYSTINYPVLLDILKQTLIAVLSSFCLAFITLMLLIIFAKNQDGYTLKPRGDEEESEKSDDIDSFFDTEGGEDSPQIDNRPDDLDDLFDTESDGDGGQNDNELNGINDFFDTEDGGDSGQSGNEPDGIDDLFDTEDGGDGGQSDGPTDLDDFFDTKDDSGIADDAADFQIPDTGDVIEETDQIEDTEQNAGFNFPEADNGEEEINLDKDTEENETEEQEPPPDEPVHRGLYSPRGNIGWEDYTGDRLDAELDRCAAADQDLVFLAMEFKDKKVMGDTLYRQIANEAVKFFKHRDLIFEKGKRGISIIVPSQALENGMAQCEEFHAQVIGKLPDALSGKNDLCMGVSSRLGRQVDAERLMFEAFQALEKALDDADSPVIGFKSDPEKYESFIRSRGADKGKDF